MRSFVISFVICGTGLGGGQRVLPPCRYTRTAAGARTVHIPRHDLVVISHSLPSHGGRHGPAAIFSFLSRLQPYLDNTHVHHFQQVMSPDQRFVQNHCKNNLTPRITSILYYFPPQTCLLPNMVEMYKSMYGSFEKLSSDNYDTWKPCISTILSAMLALKIVTGDEVKDDLPIGNSPTNIAKRESYEKRQALATTAILLSCTPKVRNHLSGITDAKAMWDTLAKQLCSSSSFGR